MQEEAADAIGDTWLLRLMAFHHVPNLPLNDTYLEITYLLRDSTALCSIDCVVIQ